MSKYYYEKSGIIDSKINITYHELFLKTDEELDEWIEEARQFIIISIQLLLWLLHVDYLYL